MTNLPIIAMTVGEQIQDVQLVMDNRERRIFKTGVVEAMPKITEVIKKLLPLYGIEAKPEHLLEITDFICTYKLIAVEEIKLAFEKFARLELNIDEHKLYGKVDLHAIGRILTAYITWRQRVYFTIDMEDEKKRAKMEEDKRQVEAKKRFYAEFPEMLSGFKGQTYEDVPAYWYDAAMKEGLIGYADGEKRAIWDEAQEIAAKQKIQADNYIDFKSQLLRVEEENKKKAVIIAQKIAVWRIVLNKK